MEVRMLSVAPDGFKGFTDTSRTRYALASNMVRLLVRVYDISTATIQKYQWSSNVRITSFLETEAERRLLGLFDACIEWGATY